MQSIPTAPNIKCWEIRGDRVSEGQVLAYVDDSNLQGELVQVQGQLDAVRARLARSQAGNRPQENA
ncbi:biotin/lipoyl-binding protein [Thermoleptolyngbya sp. M55_K2018_002]|uniref:biotin/lipoyl-binding protein n=1 Tax=Thermoleptolyngbya sp. M55_K2018_002 TaxID=2747808 RepID=UPI0019E1B5CA|nr:biotin/lipoyl-binding protein [Thermoleptolyngbya sp. M55_K2018_002]HIK42923.1 biotin/lipoyl-binding protein [Thermoleptolyngbya sp. M55_K2018_002]